MSRQKLIRFAQNQERLNIIEPGKIAFENLKGIWSSHYFKNQRPITLEIACGKGEYTIGMAKLFPERNFIGVDVKGDRIWVGSTLANEGNLSNVAFLRTNVYFLPRHFGACEINEIWLTFPDPRPRDREERRRLTNSGFLEIYKYLLCKNGWFRFKTDNTALFDYTLSMLENSTFPILNLEYTFDLYTSELLEDHYGIKTKYEQIFFDKGETIKYLKFQI